MSPVVAMVKAGDLDHRWYQYPGLFLYLLGAGVATLGPGRWDGPDAYLACRAVVAAFGVLNVGLLYFVGSRIVGVAGGLSAALLLAVSPLDIQTAHQVRADIVLQSAGILALLALRGVGENSKGDVLMGLVVGFATAVKFTGLLLVPSYLAARIVAPGRRMRGMVVAGALTVAVTLVFTPYAVIHWRQYFGLEGTAVYNTALGGPATYYKGSSELLRNLVFMLKGVAATLGPVTVALALVGAVIRLRESWRIWVPPLLHPITTLLVVSPAAIMFQRHILPAMGILYLLAVTPLEILSHRSRLAAAFLAIGAAAVSPLRLSAEYVYRVSYPSGQDKALDWINRNLPPGSRILETRPEARPGATAGAALGIDRSRYEVVALRSDEDRVGLRLLAPEMDLVITGPGAGGAWGASLRTVYEATGPLGNLVLRLKASKEELRPVYDPVDLSRALLSASENEEGVHALVDHDVATYWSTRRPMAGSEWIQVSFERPVHLGRLEVVPGTVPAGHGPDLSLLTSVDGREYSPVHAVDARPPLSEQQTARRPPSQILVLAPRPIRGVRILRTGGRREPWVVSELRLEARRESRTGVAEP